MINNKLKSSTVKSYLSVIRSVLQEDKVKLHEDLFLLTSLTWACRLQNDHMITRFPIHKSLLRTLINETENWFLNKGQVYLYRLYKALFMSAYHGLLRIGEVTESPHAIQVHNVHIGVNKNKILFIL